MDLTAIPLDLDIIPFVQARHFTPTNGRQIDLLVVHAMQAPERSITAESCANYFSHTERRASTHYCIDNDSVVRGVHDKDVAWAAPGANHNGIQLEHAGYSEQDAAQWNDPYSRSMLRLSSKLAAALCERHGIPVEYVDREGLKRGERGITTHNEVSKAFRRSDHWDPGPNFPMGTYLSLIREELGGDRAHLPDPAPRPDLPAPSPALENVGLSGQRVREIQDFLNDAGCDAGPVDGLYGPRTKSAVACWQRKLGFVGRDVDGIWGPQTQGATDRFFQFVGASKAAVGSGGKSPLTRKVLRKGARGPEVRRVQEFLAEVRLYHGRIDGIYGPKTARAVKAWQRKLGFKPRHRDGIWGPQTSDATSAFFRFISS